MLQDHVKSVYLAAKTCLESFETSLKVCLTVWLSGCLAVWLFGCTAVCHTERKNSITCLVFELETSCLRQNRITFEKLIENLKLRHPGESYLFSVMNLDNAV